MSIIKSFSVGNGDMYYINHNTDNFTIIDCCIDDSNKNTIVNEVKNLSSKKGITRFISTHPDDDHIWGIGYLDDKINILNFYCVNNNATKTEVTDDFKRYCNLRDDGGKAFYIYKGCSRKWMNQTNEERGSSGINILWPDTNNSDFKDELKLASDGNNPNNISPMISYLLENGVNAMWMGDLETTFMEKIKDDIELSKTDILFAPHHGRDSGKVPKDMLGKIDPKIVIIGEAPSKDLNYYGSYNTITQNSAGDIVFDCESNKVHIYVSNSNYSVNFLLNEKKGNNYNCYYIGTLNV